MASCSSTATNSTNAGTYGPLTAEAITCGQGGLTAGNYDFTTFVKGTLTIDKATSYMTSMRMDLAITAPDRSTTISMTMNMSFTDFNGVAGEILPPA